jgi:hypothetical protein
MVTLAQQGRERKEKGKEKVRKRKEFLKTMPKHRPGHAHDVARRALQHGDALAPHSRLSQLLRPSHTINIILILFRSDTHR